MSPEDARKILESTHFLEPVDAALRPKLVELFLQVGELITLEPDDELLHEGDVGGEQGYVVLEGTAFVTREGSSGITLEAPRLFGEMQQFNPNSVRTATVKAQSKCEALKFSWTILYMEAQRLDDDARHALQDAIEHLVWERFKQESMLDAPIFMGLSPELRLKFGLTLLWICKRKKYKVGETLFELGTLQGSDGFLLMKGVVGLSLADATTSEMYAVDIIGVTPDFEPHRTWTATATAKSPVLAFKFDWNELDAHLMNRAAPQDRDKIIEIITKNSAGKFLF